VGVLPEWFESAVAGSTVAVWVVKILTLPGDLLSYQASGLVVGAWLESGRKELDFFAGTLVGCTGRCIKIDTHSVPFLEVCLLHCISGAMFLLMLVSQCTVHPRSLAIWITLN
jgi:hypothetical protein